MSSTDAASSLHGRLIADLDRMGVSYRLITHASEGRTEMVSALRGNPLAHAAKCLIVMVKTDKKHTRYVLAVVPGNARLDLDAVKRLYGATYAGLASAEKAEDLGGSVVGTILPFAYDVRLELVVDPTLLDAPTLFFNAARLDLSIEINSDDYVRLAQPRVVRIAKPTTVERPNR